VSGSFRHDDPSCFLDLPARIFFPFLVRSDPSGRRSLQLPETVFPRASFDQFGDLRSPFFRGSSSGPTIRLVALSALHRLVGTASLDFILPAFRADARASLCRQRIFDFSVENTRKELPPFRREEGVKAFFFFLFFLPFVCRAQEAKTSPFLQQKNHLQFSKTKSDNSKALVLVRSSCLQNGGSALPSWLRGKKNISGMSAQVLHFSLEDVSEKEILLAQANPCLLGFENDRVIEVAGLGAAVPNDPMYKDQVFYPFIHLPEYLAVFSSPLFKEDLKEKTVVAVVDSGISRAHPEFLGKFWGDENGRIGYNFIDGNANIEDGLGHGSHVAGLITADSGNGIGVVGVSQAVKLMVLKTQGDDGKGSVGDVANAIRYAADHGADVINLSLSIAGEPVTLKDAVEYALEKGCVVIAASGNNGKEISTGEDFIAPAGWSVSHPGLISVGSLDSENGELSSFSNYSASFVEIAAPGSHGMTTHILSTYKNERYFALAGTSMSTPQVAGAAAQAIAFFKSKGISYTPAEVENLILTTATPSVKLQSSIQNGRQLNLENLARFLLKTYQLTSEGGLNE